MEKKSKLSESYRPAGPVRQRDGATKKMVSITVDLANLPPLTDEQRAELAALAAMPDNSIDYSDAPELPKSAWDKAVRGRFYRPTKTTTTIDIDSDVLAWLQSRDGDVVPRINAILRRAMLASRKER